VCLGKESLRSTWPTTESRSTRSDSPKLQELFTDTGTKCTKTNKLSANSLSRRMGHADQKISWSLEVTVSHHIHSFHISLFVFYRFHIVFNLTFLSFWFIWFFYLSYLSVLVLFLNQYHRCIKQVKFVLYKCVQIKHKMII